MRAELDISEASKACRLKRICCCCSKYISIDDILGVAVARSLTLLAHSDEIVVGGTTSIRESRYCEQMHELVLETRAD